MPIKLLSGEFTLRTLMLLAALVVGALQPAGPRFYPDDPLWRDDDMALDASKAEPQEDSNAYDFIVNSFGKPGERRDVRAFNVNTLDEVPDSSWFTNRIGRREMSIEEIVRGPDRGPRVVSLDGWQIVRDKGAGVQPGFRMADPTGQLYQIEVDPPSNPEMATGAELIGTAFYHAFGYHVVEVAFTEFDPDDLVIASNATIRDPYNGQRRPFERRDLEQVLRRGARLPNGRYRALVSRFAPGRPLGNFRYQSTRPDDPNDIVPHEHRRELRAARVFGAWLNHDDSRGVNSLDMLEPRENGGAIKHYMFDFGSILGSGTVFAQARRAGHEYIFEQAPGWQALWTLGFGVRPWMRIDYPDVPPAVGRFEGDAFDPAAWKPEYPNPAFENMRPDDAFWAARIVSAFSDAAIRAIVEKARYSDPKATEYVTQTIIKRRDKVVATWLNGVNPVIDPAVSADGVLTFRNAAVAARVAEGPRGYTLQWFRLDNATASRTNVGGLVSVTTSRGEVSAEVLAPASGDYIGVTITADHPSHAAWSKPATFYFRRSAGQWVWVGAERTDDRAIVLLVKERTTKARKHEDCIRSILSISASDASRPLACWCKVPVQRRLSAFPAALTRSVEGI